MAGGYGNDSYVVDDAGDVVVENANEGTMDIVYTSTVSNYTLPGEVEFLTLQGAAHLNGVGNQLGNRMIGNAGNNTRFYRLLISLTLQQQCLLTSFSVQ